MTLLCVLDPLASEEARRVRWTKLYLVALTYTGLGVVLVHTMASDGAGVMSIFLAAAALAPYLTELLRRNRHDIWDRKIGSWQANRATALGLLALFLGVVTAYVTAALLLGEAHVAASFRFALDTARIGMDTILDRRFASFGGLLFHNFAVLLTVFALAFIYRSYGALLALAWNACIWAVVLSTLVSRGLGSVETSRVGFVIIAAVALLPHLLLEASAYVIGALAAIFSSKAIAKYELRSAELRQVAVAVGMLLVAAATTLTFAGLVEIHLTPRLLDLLRPS